MTPEANGHFDKARQCLIRARTILAAGVGDLGTAAVATILALGYLAALRPLRRWIEQVAARSHCALAVTLAEGAIPHEVINRVEDHDGVTIRLLAVEKRDGHLVAVVEVEGRPEGTVVTMMGRLANLAEVTELARQ